MVSPISMVFYTNLPILIQAIKDKQTRKDAVNVLRVIGPAAKEAIPDLVKALKDEDKYVRYLAAFALRRIGPAAKDAIPALSEALVDEYGPVREEALKALDQIKGQK